MAERERVAAFIERVVAGARIPSRAGREDLRRELSAHFEDAGTSPEALESAVQRFGPEAMIAESLRRVYRWDYLAAYAAKILAAAAVSIGAALLIQFLVNLRLQTPAGGWRVAFRPPHPALSLGVVAGLVTVWEACRQPFSRVRAALAAFAYMAWWGVAQWWFATGARAFVTTTVLVMLGYGCSRIERPQAKWLVTFGVFAVAEYGMHLMVTTAFGPGRAIVASAILIAIWTSTVRILARADEAFGRLFETA